MALPTYYAESLAAGKFRGLFNLSVRGKKMKVLKIYSPGNPDVPELSVAVKDILQFVLADVARQVADVNLSGS
jgi:hypothetical protein